MGGPEVGVGGVVGREEQLDGQLVAVAWLRWGTDWALLLAVVTAMTASAAWGSTDHGAEVAQRAAHEFPLVIVVAAALGWARATLGGIPGFGWVAGRRVHEEHVTDLGDLPPVDRCRAVAVAALAGGVTAEHRAAVAAPDIARRSARIGLAARLRRGGDPFGSTTPRPVPPRDHRFDEPGSLTFVWSDGREFPDDHLSIIEAVHANYERSDLGFYPCEPGWSFTVCNVMGARSMYGHDRLHGTELWDANRDSWQRTLEQEYLTPDGTYVHIRSNHVGLSWDTGEVPGGHYTANGTGRFADILPAHGPAPGPSTCARPVRRWPDSRRWSATAPWTSRCPSGTAPAPAPCRAGTGHRRGEPRR